MNCIHLLYKICISKLNKSDNIHLSVNKFFFKIKYYWIKCFVLTESNFIDMYTMGFFIIVFTARVCISRRGERRETRIRNGSKDWIEAHRPCITLVERKWRNVGNLIVALIVI